MNPTFYDLIIQKKLSAAPAKAKEIRYRVRKVVKNHVIKYISTPIIEEPEPEPQSSAIMANASADSYHCYS
jgi:hypothetical protein